LTNDYSPGGYNGTIVGATWQPTQKGAALYFADNQRVNCGNRVPGPGYGSYTVAAFVSINTTQPDSSSGYRYAAVAGRGILVAGSVGSGLFLSNECPAYQVRTVGVPVSAAISSTAINDGLWHSCIGVLRRSGTPVEEIWVDGILKSSASAANFAGLNLSPLSTMPWGIGSRCDGSATWNFDLRGHVGCVAVWSRALQAGEIADWHAAPYSMFESGMTVVFSLSSRRRRLLCGAA
jgi:hypothetical protein